MAIVVRVAEHKLSNCYGFLSNQPNKFIESSSFAVFKCSQVDETSEKSFALQVFASKPPFEYLHLNRIFLHRLGLKLDDQLILEQVSSVNYCQWMEIRPETFEDWNIIENTSEVIEEDFLRQIRVVQEDLPFVLFLSSGIPINFKVVQIGPKPPKGSAMLISNMTQVMVGSLSSPKLSEYSLGYGQRGFDVPHDSVSLINPIRFFIDPEKPQALLRVLPRHYLKNLHKRIPNSTVITIGKGQYIKTTICRIIRGGSSIFINLVELPRTSGGFHASLDIVYDVLEKMPHNHCYISPDLQHQGIQPYERITCLPVKEYEIHGLKEVLYSSSVAITPKTLELALRSHLKDKLYVPFFVPDYGCEISLANSVKFVSTEGLDGIKQCGVFLVDKLPQLKKSEHDVKLPPSPDYKIIHNFGEKPSKSTLFDFQSEFCSTILSYLTPICQQNESNSFNVLICGEEFSGKTTILNALATSLYEKGKVFSLKIDCNDFKGKSPDNIASQLDQKLHHLQSRWPSVLFLDQLDFLNNELEDEERNKFVSKVYYKISSLITEYKIPVVTTAKSQHSVALDSLNLHGKRFFTLIMDIPQLGQVC